MLLLLLLLVVVVVVVVSRSKVLMLLLLVLALMLVLMSPVGDIAVDGLDISAAAGAAGAVYVGGIVWDLVLSCRERPPTPLQSV